MFSYNLSYPSKVSLIIAFSIVVSLYKPCCSIFLT
nr:MAG TPA: hypothetical protein [Bacteriophage sp.]